MASSPTTVASTANISTLTEQMMMLEIDDIDETNCAPDSAANAATRDMNMFANGSQLDENSNYSQEQALNMTKEEQMQRLMMQHFFTSQIQNNDNLARMAILSQLGTSNQQ